MNARRSCKIIDNELHQEMESPLVLAAGPPRARPGSRAAAPWGSEWYSCRMVGLEGTEPQPPTTSGWSGPFQHLRGWGAPCARCLDLKCRNQGVAGLLQWVLIALAHCVSRQSYKGGRGLLPRNETAGTSPEELVAAFPGNWETPGDGCDNAEGCQLATAGH